MDLASTHVVNNTLDFLQQQVKFVPHGADLPCIASLRLIKDFWAALKKAVLDKGCEAPSFPSLKGKICQKTHSFSSNSLMPLQHQQGEADHLCVR